MGREYQQLLTKAEEASAGAYAPYSHFYVGAALLCEDGTVVTGCNVENASYGLCLCAERVAISKAVSEGKRHFKALAVSASRMNPMTNELEVDSSVRPCGACLQVMMEFFQKDTTVICPSGKNVPLQFSMQDLLPHAFNL